MKYDKIPKIFKLVSDDNRDTMTSLDEFEMSIKGVKSTDWEKFLISMDQKFEETQKPIYNMELYEKYFTPDELNYRLYEIYDDYKDNAHPTVPYEIWFDHPYLLINNSEVEKFRVSFNI